jgi:hypothetical protein
MAKITEEMKEVIQEAKVFAVATASKDGEPNVVPIAFGKMLSEDEILLVDNFMKKTMENLNTNPKVAVSVWKAGDSKGYQFKGDVRIETSGSNFDDGVKMVKAKEPKLNPKAVVIVEVKSIYSITPGPDAGKLVS